MKKMIPEGGGILIVMSSAATMGSGQWAVAGQSYKRE